MELEMEDTQLSTMDEPIPVYVYNEYSRTKRLRGHFYGGEIIPLSSELEEKEEKITTQELRNKRDVLINSLINVETQLLDTRLRDEYKDRDMGVSGKVADVGDIVVFTDTHSDIVAEILDFKVVTHQHPNPHLRAKYTMRLTNGRIIEEFGDYILAVVPRYFCDKKGATWSWLETLHDFDKNGRVFDINDAYPKETA